MLRNKTQNNTLQAVDKIISTMNTVNLHVTENVTGGNKNINVECLTWEQYSNPNFDVKKEARDITFFWKDTQKHIGS